MRVFTCDDHDGHYVGVASVIVAEDETAARKLLDAELASHGLTPTNGFRGSYTLTELNLAKARAVVLQDGDY